MHYMTHGNSVIEDAMQYIAIGLTPPHVFNGQEWALGTAAFVDCMVDCLMSVNLEGALRQENTASYLSTFY